MSTSGDEKRAPRQRKTSKAGCIRSALTARVNKVCRLQSREPDEGFGKSKGRPPPEACLEVSMSNSPPFRGSRYWVSGYPELAQQWDHERNGSLSPKTVSAGAGRPIWWRCPEGSDHIWRAKPNNRTRGAGCPFCANHRVSSTNNLAVCFPRIAAEWHPWKNGTTRPSDVLAGSSRVCFWQCSRGHEWRAGVRDRTRGHRACPYCAHRRVAREESLATRHPTLAAEWDSATNTALSPNDVTPGSSRVVGWRCRSNPEHRWRASVANRVLRASACPYCVRRRAVPGGVEAPLSRETAK